MAAWMVVQKESFEVAQRVESLVCEEVVDLEGNMVVLMAVQRVVSMET